MIEKAVYVSSPVVGSSRKSTEGLVMSSIPIAVRLRSPPETPPFSVGDPIIVSAHFSRCISWMICRDSGGGGVRRQASKVGVWGLGSGV